MEGNHVLGAEEIMQRKQVPQRSMAVALIKCEHA